VKRTHTSFLPFVLQVFMTPEEAFQNCSVIVILDEVVQRDEETYEHWMKRNHKFFVSYAKTINEVAQRNVRVLIAGNGPVNFNTMFMIRNCPNVRVKCCQFNSIRFNKAVLILKTKEIKVDCHGKL
jgi:malate/lactate dehydrogenase